MTRVTYELGARGADIDTEDFVRKIREYGDYYTGRWSEETIKSVQKSVFLDSGKTLAGFNSQLRAWSNNWSEQYPDIEVFYTLTEYRGSELMYGSFRGGIFLMGETIITHSRFSEILGECDCQLRSGFYEKYPTDTPFSDCPVRLNPPTAWAIENIMYAHERIGMR
jgi:hypothetical protein